MTEERLALLIARLEAAAATELAGAMDAATSDALRRWMKRERIGGATMAEEFRLQIALVEGFLAFLRALGATPPSGE